MRNSIATVSVVAALLAVSAHPANAQDKHVLVTPDAIQWQPAPPVFPAGAQIAVLEGNPAEKGPVTLRLKFPADYVVAPHWHTMAERVTVVSGTLYVGMGDSVDRAKSQALKTGGYVSLPGKMHHYAWVKTPAIVQVSLDGPFDMVYVNPADDPQRKPTTAGR